MIMIFTIKSVSYNQIIWWCKAWNNSKIMQFLSMCFYIELNRLLVSLKIYLIFVDCIIHICLIKCDQAFMVWIWLTYHRTCIWRIECFFCVYHYMPPWKMFVYLGLMPLKGSIISQYSHQPWIKLQPAIFPLSQHVIRFHELPDNTTQRFLQ